MVKVDDMMKKILYFSIALLTVSCQHEVAYDVDYNVTLDASNTYYAGDPVRFNIKGEVDNITFYSGEMGSQYIYKDRFSVPVESVRSAELRLQIQPQWGYNGGFDIYVTDSFEGLLGNDGEADRATMRSMYEAGMQGWTKVEWADPQGAGAGSAEAWIDVNVPMSDYIDNAVVAFHFHPKRDGVSAQRSYGLKGGVSLDMEGIPPVNLDLVDLGFTVVNMNEEVGAYDINIPNTPGGNTYNGRIRFDYHQAPIFFNGAGATALEYAIDSWCISNPAALNRVTNDKGVAIKNMQNYLSHYEYVFNEPGTYEVTFVGINSNYAMHQKKVKTLRVTILENLND